MYDIVQHVTGTSNAIARGNDGDDLKSYEIQQAFDYDYCSNVCFARRLIFPRALKKSNGAKIDKVR